MQTYRVDKIIEKNRKLTISGLPFRVGERVEVIILSRLRKIEPSENYPLRGKPVRYLAPFEPVAENDWDANQ